MKVVVVRIRRFSCVGAFTLGIQSAHSGLAVHTAGVAGISLMCGLIRFGLEEDGWCWLFLGMVRVALDMYKF